VGINLHGQTDRQTDRGTDGVKLFSLSDIMQVCIIDKRILIALFGIPQL
jgi:hypothetical protein